MFGNGEAMTDYNTKFLSNSRLNTIVKKHKTLKGCDLFHKCFLASKIILEHVFGGKWVSENFDLEDSALYKNNLDYRGDERSALDRKIESVCLAELIISTQSHSQVKPIIERIYQGQIEEGFFELEVAGVFAFQNIEFHFNVPSKIKSKSYDFDVKSYDGVEYQVEVKCKISETVASTNTIKNTLSDARRQLPENGNGIIIIKYPQNWIEHGSFLQIDNNVYENFLRNTSRVKKIVVFMPWVNFLSDRVQNCTLFEIIDNKKYPSAEIFSINVINNLEKFSLYDSIYGSSSSVFQYSPLNFGK